MLLPALVSYGWNVVKRARSFNRCHNLLSFGGDAPFDESDMLDGEEDEAIVKDLLEQEYRKSI